MTKWKPPKPREIWDNGWNGNDPRPPTGSGISIYPTTKVKRRRPGSPPIKSSKRSPYDKKR